MMVVALLNGGLAAVCALLGLAASGLPALAGLWQIGLAPASAVAASAVLAGGWRLVPGALAGVFAATLALRPDLPLLALAAAASIGVGAVWSAVYTRHAVGGRVADLLLTLRGVLAFLALAAGSFALWTAALGALAEIVVAQASKAPEAFQASLLHWGVSHYIAIVVLAPPALLMAAGGLRVSRWVAARRALIWLAVALVSWLIFTAGPEHVSLAAAVPVLVLPVLLAIAALSAAKSAVALTVFSAIAAATTATGTSAWGEGHGIYDLATMAVLLFALAVSALPFAALMRERREAAAALAATNADLEARVAARTAEAVAGEARLRHMLDGSPVAVCVVQPDGRLAFTNVAFRSLFGLAPADAADFDVAALYEEPEDRAAQIDRLMREGVALDMEYRYRRRDGSPVWVLEHSVLSEFDGRPAILAWMIDISARKEAAQALARAQAELAAHRDQLAAEVAERTADLRKARDAAEAASRAKTEFLANMSHELRTPLNAIIGFAQMIENDLMVATPEARSTYREYAGNIHRSGGHLLAVIDDILDMARFETGRLTVAEERVELGPCIDRAITLTAPPPGAEAPAVAVDLPRRAPALRGDRRRIEQMLVKLLSNAVRFTPGSGRITLRVVREPGGALTLSVTDTGIGMTEQEIERALRPFVQVDTGLGRRYEGTGLGLPLARAFADLHGATLMLESRPGDGTTVTVRFPADRVLEPYALPQAESA